MKHTFTRYLLTGLLLAMCWLSAKAQITLVREAAASAGGSGAAPYAAGFFITPTGQKWHIPPLWQLFRSSGCFLNPTSHHPKPAKNEIRHCQPWHGSFFA